MACRSNRVVIGNGAVHWGLPAWLLLALGGVLVLAGCGGGKTLRNPSLRADIVGYWEVTKFDEHNSKMPTCFGNDAAVAFRADGTWTGFNRTDFHDTYAGTYKLSSPDKITLVAGITQRYTVTLADDVLTLRDGRALVIQLQRTAEPQASVVEPSGGLATPAGGHD